MSYSKNTWNNGDVITKTKLDNIENGIYNNAVTQVAVNNGVASFKNADNTELFTLTLPDGSSYVKLGSGEFAANTTSTTAISLGEINVTASDLWTSAKMILVTVRDKAGKRAGYFLGTDAIFANPNPKNGSSTSLITNPTRLLYRVSSDNDYEVYNGTTVYGVYAYDINDSGRVRIYARYNSTYSYTINGTFLVEVWALDYPNGTPFE